MGNSSFTVLPMSQRFALEPGKTYTGKLSIVNPAESTEDFHYVMSVSPYGVTGEDYDVDFATVTNRSEIVKWIKISEPTGSVKPNETKEVEFTITVPEDAAGGGQYALIAVSSNETATATEGVAVNNVFELASIVYATVSGETKHEGEILENNVPGFVVKTPVTLSALISNNGNVHEDATFVISVSNAFTGQVILPTEDNEGRYNELIMPDTTREITREINNLPALGIIKINQTIYYLGDVKTVEKNVIICPIWFMLLLGVTILAIIGAIVGTVLKHKRRISV
ncbi:hypothetical protein IKF85_02425 [Candidatus Saccharibacteria bacterium]|nr:hypothetical protein [Candidatus Saccharibacteria bacterium]